MTHARSCRSYSEKILSWRQDSMGTRVPRLAFSSNQMFPTSPKMISPKATRIHLFIAKQNKVLDFEKKNNKKKKTKMKKEVCLCYNPAPGGGVVWRRILFLAKFSNYFFSRGRLRHGENLKISYFTIFSGDVVIRAVMRKIISLIFRLSTSWLFWKVWLFAVIRNIFS